MLFWDNTAVLASFIVLFSVGYMVLYWRIVRFRRRAGWCSHAAAPNRRGRPGQG